MRERKVKAVIPKPSNDSMLDRLGSTVQEETQKTRHMILWLAVIQATATIVAASIALVV